MTHAVLAWASDREGTLERAAGPSNSRLHTPSSHTETIDPTGHEHRGYLNRLDNMLGGQVKIWQAECVQ